MLVDEVFKRTGIKLRTEPGWPERAGSQVIVVGQESALNELAFLPCYIDELSRDPAAVGGAEGFRIRVDADGPYSAVFVLGNDERGVLFGVGRLLRALQMTPGRIAIDSDFSSRYGPSLSAARTSVGIPPKN